MNKLSTYNRTVMDDVSAEATFYLFADQFIKNRLLMFVAYSATGNVSQPSLLIIITYLFVATVIEVVTVGYAKVSANSV